MAEGWITKGHKETSECDENVCCLACDDGFTGINVCQNWPNCIPEICAVYYISFKFQKGWKIRMMKS